MVAFSPPRKVWLPEWLKVEHFVVASDGMMGFDIKGERLNWDSPYESYAGHPRTTGSHAIVLRLARENGVPLMHTLSQLSYWTAKHLGDTGLKAMQERGRMQQGMVADITLFNPDTVTEHATFKKGTNGIPSTGIPYVLVNGTIVVKDSKVLKDVNPGQPIRFPVEEKGRFVPVSGESWLKSYTVKTNPPTIDIDDSSVKPKREKPVAQPSNPPSAVKPSTDEKQQQGSAETKPDGGLFVREPEGLASFIEH